MPDNANADGRKHPQGTGRTDVIVIGAGLSGLAAAGHAIRAGAKVRLIAMGWGQQKVAPGWISVCDRAEDDVIAEVRGHAVLHPEHPYGLAGADAMLQGLEQFRALAEEAGLFYDWRQKDGHNMRLMTALGAIQRPAMAPRAMAYGDLTDVSGPVLLVGFTGWRDFYPEMAVNNLRAQGFEARALWVTLPGVDQYWDPWPNELAQSFDNAAFYEAIARQVQPHARDAALVGFPAVLGQDNHNDTVQRMAEQIGRPVFEIPTLPPSMPGHRLSRRLTHWMLHQRARVQVGHPVVRARVENGRCLSVEVEALGHINTFYADEFILATGGLYNGGIKSHDAGRLWEPLFDLPLVTPPGEDRADWYHERLLFEHGHPIHRDTGVRVNPAMRPLNAAGEPVLENVAVIGQMLAGFNPLTDGCAEGIELATAYKAVQTALQLDTQETTR